MLSDSGATGSSGTTLSWDRHIEFPYRDGVDLAAISVLLGHAAMKTTRDHYTSPSLEQMREIANRRNDVIPEEEPLWLDDENELSRILGLD